MPSESMSVDASARKIYIRNQCHLAVYNDTRQRGTELSRRTETGMSPIPAADTIGARDRKGYYGERRERKGWR
ncbi:hypothetical protein EVAR_955_1 [Eumeta japonica]|uniref:Uncharacterized protein n=1 Tax=Eumeta variegata TaxID=151549 RepID=A0A4C1SEU0_EUMVA|nr:hypothetical protein EVAR_955_1 [Eumeta japonica]